MNFYTRSHALLEVDEDRLRRLAALGDEAAQAEIDRLGMRRWAGVSPDERWAALARRWSSPGNMRGDKARWWPDPISQFQGSWVEYLPESDPWDDSYRGLECRLIAPHSQPWRRRGVKIEFHFKQALPDGPGPLGPWQIYWPRTNARSLPDALPGHPMHAVARRLEHGGEITDLELIGLLNSSLPFEFVKIEYNSEKRVYR